VKITSTIIHYRDCEGTNMRKIALIGMVLITITTLGCSKKSEEPATQSQMSPAPASQEAAPAPAPAEQTAPMSGDSMAKPEESNGDAGKDNNSGD
jgi:hypothetical protein